MKTILNYTINKLKVLYSYLPLICKYYNTLQFTLICTKIKYEAFLVCPLLSVYVDQNSVMNSTTDKHQTK